MIILQGNINELLVLNKKENKFVLEIDLINTLKGI